MVYLGTPRLVQLVIVAPGASPVLTFFFACVHLDVEWVAYRTVA